MLETNIRLQDQQMTMLHSVRDGSADTHLKRRVCPSEAVECSDAKPTPG